MTIDQRSIPVPQVQEVTASGRKLLWVCGEQVGVPCPSCDIINPVDARYCYDCGERLYPPPWELESDVGSTVSAPVRSTERRSGSQLTCQRCHATNEPGAVYCYECGLPLAEEPAHASEAAPPPIARSASSYRSSRTRARWTIGLVLVVCFVSMGYMARLNTSLDLLNRQDDGQTVSRAALREATGDVGTAADLLLFTYVASAIAFLVWQYRVSRNLPRISAYGQQFSPTWAVIWWIVQSCTCSVRTR